MKVKQVGLFEGYGGLSMAVSEVLGAELAYYSEIDPAASRLLAHHHPDVPNLGDVTQIDWAEVRDALAEHLLVLTGGFPCQDVSLAGRRAGIRPGTRSGLWTHFAYAIDQLRPGLVVIENVRGLLSADAACDLEPCPWCLGDNEGRPLRALGAVLGDLAELGYDARWCGLRAADVGAPHGRFRVFVTAWPAADADSAALRDEPVAQPRCGGAAVAGQPGVVGLAAADATRLRRGEGRAESARLVGGSNAASDSDAVRHTPMRGWDEASAARRSDEPARAAGGSGLAPAPDAHRDGLSSCQERDGKPSEAGSEASAFRQDTHGRTGPKDASPWGDYEPAVRHWELILGRPAPAPTQAGARGGQQLSPVFVEWLMGLPEGHVTAVPGLTRNEQLGRLGNGVVPQQAAAALRHLLEVESWTRAA